MNLLQIADYRVKELSSDEMQAIDGGGWWQDFKQGFVDGFTWAFDSLIDLFTKLSSKE